MLSGSMSPAGAEKYWTDADQRFSEFDCKQCEQHRDYLLKYSPVIRFMNDNINKLGGDMGPHNVHCRTCTDPREKMHAGFDYKYGIKICANYVQDKKTMEDVLAHEMVHAFDHLRFKTNLSAEDDLRHAACSEVIPLVNRDGSRLMFIDPSQQSQRRMSLGKRVLQEQDPSIHKPPSRLCTTESRPFSHGQTAM